MSIPDPIIPASELACLTNADQLHNQAMATLQDAQTAAVRLKDFAQTDGRAEGLADGCAEAAKLLTEARASIAARTAELEDTLAQLVADTVRDIIGEGDRNQIVRKALQTALARLSAKDPDRLYVAQDMASPVHEALTGIDGTLQVTVDEDLPNGVVLLSNSTGHAHIGLDAQVDNALATLEGRALKGRVV